MVLLPAEGQGQRNQRIRQGFFFGAGLGYGSLTLPGDADSRDRVGGYLKVGGSVNSRLLVGGESIIFVDRGTGSTLAFVTLVPTLWLYPLGETPLYLKAGAGLAVLEEDRGFLGGTNNDGGLGLTAGLGWDLHFGESFAVTPYANWARGSFEPGAATLWQIGVGLTGF
jgi:hypothetical protein